MPRYIINLTSEERKELKALTTKGRSNASRIAHANILLLADTSAEGPAWKNEQIAEAVGLSDRSVEHVKQRIVEQGLVAALGRKKEKIHPLSIYLTVKKRLI